MSNSTLDEILRWLKKNRENSTFISPRHVVLLFGSSRGLREWCAKHQLEQSLTGDKKFRITNDDKI